MKTYTYGRQSVDEDDIAAVVEALRADFLTGGPGVQAFEQAICEYTGAKYAVAVANATAGLHLAALAAGLQEGDEAITSPITFLSSANCVRYVGATVRFADIEPETANISPAEIRHQLTPRCKAIIPVHFAGQSCDMASIAALARERGLVVIEDAAHALGSEYRGSRVGSCRYSDMTVFSFHPVKTITTGEGGAITTNSEALYHKLLACRAHGVHREGCADWRYEMRELGFNYRLTDIQAALGLSQLRRLERFKRRRREIVAYYNERLGLPHLVEHADSNACFHLYPVLVEDREGVYRRARQAGLHLQVHYIPVHTQPYYRALGWREGDFPRAESYYARCLSLPLYPNLSNEDVQEIVKRMKSVI